MKIPLSLAIVVPVLTAAMAAGESSSSVPPADNNNEIQYKSGLRGLQLISLSSPPPPPTAPPQTCPEEKKRELFHYDIDIHVSLGASRNCTDEEEKLIGERLEESVQKVFQDLEQRLGKFYDNHLETTPLNSFRRALLSSLPLSSGGDSGGEESVYQNSNSATTKSDESGSKADDGGSTVKHDNDYEEKETKTRGLGEWGGGFVYKGHGRCSACDNDNEDERRRRLTSDDFLETKLLAEVHLNADSTTSLVQQADVATLSSIATHQSITSSSSSSSGELGGLGGGLGMFSGDVIGCLESTFPVVSYRLIHKLDEGGNM